MGHGTTGVAALTGCCCTGNRRPAIGRVRRSTQEAQRTNPEVPDIREHRGQAGLRHSKPLRQGGSILIHGGGRNQHAAVVGIVVAAGHQQREVPIELAALHARADDEVMIAPGVIAAIVAAGGEGAPELGRGEGGDGAVDRQFLGGLIEGQHGLA
jgi:hypothetical protein